MMSPYLRRFVLHIGEMRSRWGLNRTLGQMCGLLYVVPEPMNADEIAETLNTNQPMPVNSPSENTPAEVTVWYDSDCPLCIREIDLMRRLDKRRAINFVEIQTAVACPVDSDALMKRFHAQERDQPIVSGAAAFAAMWRAIPMLRPLGLLAKSRPVLWVLERLYIGFLRIRPWLQRRVRRIVQD